jgi:aryl-alcohol dehydrogenase-like predicted oxidoreductase
MELRNLGPLGLRVSAPGLGCMGMSTTYGPSDDRESLARLDRAAGLGVTFFDTAEVYGPFHNEELIGRAFSVRRAGLMLATKMGFEFTDDGRLKTANGTPVVNGRPDHVTRAVEGSLRRLRTDHIDLLCLHRIDPAVPVEDTVGALAGLVAAGKVGHLDLSEAAPSTIRRAHAVHPVTALQIEYSLFERGVEVNGVLAAAREVGDRPCSLLPARPRLPDRPNGPPASSTRPTSAPGISG